MQRNQHNRVELIDLKDNKPFSTLAANAREILRKQSGEDEPRYVLKSEFDRAAYAEDVSSAAKTAAVEAKDAQSRQKAARNAVKGKNPEQVAATIEALKTVLNDGPEKRPEDFTSKGEVKTSTLTGITGFDVTSTMRAAAYDELAKDQ